MTLTTRTLVILSALCHAVLVPMADTAVSTPPLVISQQQGQCTMLNALQALTNQALVRHLASTHQLDTMSPAQLQLPKPLVLQEPINQMQLNHLVLMPPLGTMSILLVRQLKLLVLLELTNQVQDKLPASQHLLVIM